MGDVSRKVKLVVPFGWLFLAGALASAATVQETRTLAGAALTPVQPSATVAADIQRPPPEALPPPPEAVVAVGGDAIVTISWLPSPQQGILGYNVYRSTKAGMYGTVPLNRALIRGTEFTDSDANSTMAPANRQLYFYVVRAVDTQGRLSVPSEEAKATPEGAPVISEVPRVAWEGMGESQLAVSGRKVVSLGYTVREPKYGPGSSQLSGPLTQRPDIQQQLQVRLSGTVGKKISVDVDYDDTAPEQTRQRISVVYTGEPEETIERAEFGDIRLQLSDTEFTGYDKQLFGVRVQAQPIERLRVTGIATQTQGINASEQFVGNSSRQQPEFSDSSYTTLKYFYITRPAQTSPVPIAPHLGIKPGSEQVWLDDGIATNNTINTRMVGGFSFDLLAQGVDYSIDYATGIINFNRSIPASAAIAVAFEFNDGTKVPFQGGDIRNEYGVIDPSDPANPTPHLKSNWDITTSYWAETTTDHHLIYDGAHTGGGDAHMLTNKYTVGWRNIVPKDFDPEFTIQVLDASGREVSGVIIPILDSDFYDFGILTIRGASGRGGHPDIISPTPAMLACLPDRSAPAYSNPNALYRDPPASEQPFAWDPNNVFYCVGNGAYSYGTNTNHVGRYTIKIRLLTRQLSYRLRNINIVRGSEKITMDGRVLRRDVDYFIDYDFGQVTFLRPDQIRYDSHIQIDYEYLPFGGQFQSFLWGARAQYGLSDKASLGATYLSNNSQNPAEVPSPTAAPKSTSIAGADGRVFMSRRDLSTFTQVLPGFEKAILPLEMELRGEVARSDINPNTFKQSGVDEDGVGMVDSFEGVDDIVEAGVDLTSWFPASIPDGTGSLSRAGTLAWHTADGGHATTLERRLELAYKDFDSSKWDGIRYVLSPIGLDISNYQYVEMWVHGDGNPVEMAVDIGVLSEDSNGNGALDTEDKNGDFTLNSGEDAGINGDNAAYWGGCNGFWKSWAGPGCGMLNTEDTNGNGVLDKSSSYFEYKMKVWWTGWKFVKIPLNLTSNNKIIQAETDTQGERLDVDFTLHGSPQKSVVRHMRIWLGNAGGSLSGELWIEPVAITGNRWLLRTTPGIPELVDASRFNVSAISKEKSSAYTPSFKFFTIKETGDERLEQSLELDYKVWDGLDGNYFAARTFASPMSLLDYKWIKFEINKFRVVNSGEVLFLRAGADDLNYYQYNIPLDSIAAGWQTVTVDFLDERNRVKVGNPALSSVRQFSFGIVRYNTQPAAAIPEVIWINDLRLSGSKHKTGIARKVNIRLATPMGATFTADPNQEIMPANVGVALDTTYRELDNDFRTIDQPTYLLDDMHRRSVVSNAQIRQIPKLPIQAQFQRDEAWVEAQHLDDPAYYSRPERVVTTLNTTVASEHLSPVSLDVSTGHQVETQHFLTELAGADFRRVAWSVSPRARVPLEGWWLIVPVGTNGEITGMASYAKESIDYRESALRPTVVDRTTETLDEQYTARTNYQPFAPMKGILPILPGLSSSPRGGYKLKRARGSVGSLQVANIAQTTSIVSEHRFQPIQQEITAGLDNSLGGIKGLTPSSNYSAQVSRDFTLLSMNTITSLNNNLELRPGEWWKPLQDQTFNLGYTIDTNGQYYDTLGIDAQGRQYVTDAIIKRVPPKDIWWIGRKQDALTTSNAYAETYTAAGSLRFYKIWQVTPNWSFREDTRLQQKLRTRTEAVTAGSGLALLQGELVDAVFQPTPLFWMHFNGFDAGYSYRKATTFDFRDFPSRMDESHSATATLPFSPVKNMTGNIAFATDIATTGTFAYDVLTDRTLPAVWTFTRNYRPSLGVTYNYAAGLNIPLIWWKLKLSNTITIRHNLQYNFIDNEASGQPTGNRRAREMSDSTDFEYEMLRGVNFRMTEKYDQVKDYTTPTNSFYAFSLYATFMFNF